MEKEKVTEILEYIWIGGKGEIRSKTKVLTNNNIIDNFHINNIPLPKSEVLEVSKSILNQDDSSDDDWDTDDFVPRMQQHVQQNIQQEIIPSKAIEDKIDITPDIESHIADIPDDWNSL